MYKASGGAPQHIWKPNGKKDILPTLWQQWKLSHSTEAGNRKTVDDKGKEATKNPEQGRSLLVRGEMVLGYYSVPIRRWHRWWSVHLWQEACVDWRH